MKASVFYQLLKENGFGPFIGVPCSILAPFLKLLDKEELIATNEGEAMGIASGLYLTGKRPVVFMQNSGLCNALNPLTSLNLVYKIPLLLIITLRGEPGTEDAPQHRIVGQKTRDFLELLDIEYRYITDDPEELKGDMGYLKTRLEKDLKPAAFLLRRDVFKKHLSGNEVTDITAYALTRQAAVDEIAKSLNNNCLVVTTTGKITREYYYCKNRRGKIFYMVGSMGCASAIGLGIATGIENNKKVVVLDGDGAVLMKMGNLATIGNLRPKNLIHIVLDNQCHESTGGQKTSSITTALEEVAKGCGYLYTHRVTNLKQIQLVVREALNIDGPAFILIKIAKMSDEKDKLGRPKESPEEIKKQFMYKIRE